MNSHKFPQIPTKSHEIPRNQHLPSRSSGKTMENLSLRMPVASELKKWSVHDVIQKSKGFSPSTRWKLMEKLWKIMGNPSTFHIFDGKPWENDRRIWKTWEELVGKRWGKLWTTRANRWKTMDNWWNDGKHGKHNWKLVDTSQNTMENRIETMVGWQPPIESIDIYHETKFLMLSSLRYHKSAIDPIQSPFGWWFGSFSICPYIGKNHPNWRMFFRDFETSNQRNNGKHVRQLWDSCETMENYVWEKHGKHAKLRQKGKLYGNTSWIWWDLAEWW